MNASAASSESEALPLALPWSLRFLRSIPLPRKLGLLEHLYGRRLARHGAAWVRTAPGPLWKLDLGDVCNRWVVYGDYEGPVQMRWIRGWLRDGDTVIDSGANIGQMLLYFASAARVKVLAFEPLPGARDWLLECLERHPDWSVEILDAGLAADAGVATLQVRGAMSTTRMDWYATRSLDSVEIRLEALDTVLADRGVGQVRLWKLDVEGGEAAAIRGATDSLRARRIEAVLVESAPERFAEIRTAFESVGFSLFEIRRGALRPAGGLRFGNLLALPEEREPTTSVAVLA